MPLKSSETADSRVIGRGEWSPASRRHTYVAPSVLRVNPSGVLKKLRNTIQVQTKPSPFYRQTRLSALQLKAADWRAQIAGNDIMKLKVTLHLQVL